MSAGRCGSHLPRVRRSVTLIADETLPAGDRRVRRAPSMKRFARYQGAIVRDDHVLLLKVVDRPTRETFWLIPGGGRIEPESEEACVEREMREETELEVVVRRLLLDVPAFSP